MQGLSLFPESGRETNHFKVARQGCHSKRWMDTCHPGAGGTQDEGPWFLRPAGLQGMGSTGSQMVSTGVEESVVERPAWRLAQCTLDTEAVLCVLPHHMSTPKPKDG